VYVNRCVCVCKQVCTCILTGVRVCKQVYVYVNSNVYVNRCTCM